MSNVVLIGMPGCGKTTVGAWLAARLGRPLLDTDAMVVAAEGMSIPDLFARQGEAYFREAEANAARSAARETDAVISTGGGIILRPENMETLGKTGMICFIDRPPEEIASEDHAGRPLIGASRERIFMLYAQRIGLYRQYAQIIIPSRPTPEKTARALLERLEGML